MNHPAAQNLRASDTALDYVHRGLAVVPVPFREKGPQLKGWQQLRIKPEQVARYFPDRMNIGVILGVASGGLVDVDIDCAEALEIGCKILPKTGSIFGRASKPGSHRLYRIDGLAQSLKLNDPTNGDTLIELRGDKQDGTAGFQTIFPGSIHPSGEPIEWEEDGEASFIEYNELKRHALKLATRALIARHCPGVTTTDELRRALAQADPRIMLQIERWRSDVDGARSLDGAHVPLLVTEADTAQLSRLGRRSLCDIAARIGHGPLQVTQADIARVWTALSFISSRNRNDWIEVGAALHDIAGWPEELRRAIWDYWSTAQDLPPHGERKKFEQTAQDNAWRSFDRPYTGARATLGTIFYRARQAGWNGRTLKRVPDEIQRFLPGAIAPAPAVHPQTQAEAQDQARAAPTDTSTPPDDVAREAAIKRLAELALVQYEKERKDAADKHGIRVSVLDKLVNAQRGDGEDGELQGHALKLFEPEPWPDVVNGRALVSDLVKTVQRFVVMSKDDALIVALWVLHSYVFEVFMCTPRLCITSPEKRCGKTTLLDVLSYLVNRPLPTANITGPAIFRTIEQARPTLLFDEADNTFGRNGKAVDGGSDILANLNSGHRQGGQVIRLVGDEFEPRAFGTHSPVVLALIGNLPGTLDDRSIHVHLRRKLAGNRVEHFRIDRTEDLQRLARQIRRWCEDNRSVLAASEPDIPEGLFNREADNWRPLLAIAAAGGCSSEARAVASKAAAQNTDDARGVMLLTDIRLAFDEPKTDKLKSEQLVEHLNHLEGRPWADYRRSTGITKHWLVRTLAPFGIKPEPEPISFPDGARVRGYLRSRFDDAFARYLPPRSVQT